MMCWRMCSIFFLLCTTKIGQASQPTQHQQRLQAATANEAVFDHAFDAFVEATLHTWHVPGLSIAVVDNGKIFSKGYGYAVLPDQNATADTQYFTGSTTKAFTAAAAALLVHDEAYPEVKWTSPINRFIREDFVFEDAYATNHITIEDLLSHRTGLPGHDLIYGQINDTPSSVVQRIRYLPMTAEPRTMWQYCNIMYGVVTDLLETITGQKLDKMLRKTLWEPLGMLSTTFTLPSASDENSRLARGYYWPPSADGDRTSIGKDEYVPEPYIDISSIAGAGSTISTVNDYALWVRALLDVTLSGRPTNTSSPISHTLLRDLWSPRTIMSDFSSAQDNASEFATPPGYALGWITAKLDALASETLVAHSGGLTGFGTELYMLPNKGYGVITMGNTGVTSNDAGSIICARLLLHRLDRSAADELLALTVQRSLREISRAVLNPSKFKGYRKRKADIPTLRSKASLLPGTVALFAGVYSHPGYGTINFTVVDSRNGTSQSEGILEGLLYPRMWPQKIQLSHITDTVFAVQAWSPHGLGDLESGRDIVWEEETSEDDLRAVFEYGLDGETVETMGIETEYSMVKAAHDRGVKHWKDGMIWFDKISS